MIDAETKKHLDELVALNQQLLARFEELQAEREELNAKNEELTKQLASEDRFVAMKAENVELRKRLAAATSGHALPSTTPAYDQLAKLAQVRAGNEGVTFEKAFAKVVAEQPDLMQQHRDEMRSS